MPFTGSQICAGRMPLPGAQAQCWLVATQWLPYRFVQPRTQPTSMSTIELVDPELRDALALWSLPPLTPIL
jgi:hypothetical protein